MITWRMEYMEVADYHSIPTIVVEEHPRKHKQGLSSYRVVCFKWYGKMIYQVEIEACWLIDCFPCFDSLRYAWAFIQKYTVSTTKGERA